MAKHGCFSSHGVRSQNSLKNASRQKRSELLIIFVAFSIAVTAVATLSGCAIGKNGNGRSDQRLSKTEILERRLRRAQAKIETLRERNLILKSRIKIISRNGGAEALQPQEELKGFDSGVVLDVPIDSRRQPPKQETPGREDVSLTRRLPAKQRSTQQQLAPKSAVKTSSSVRAIASTSESRVSNVQGEQADRALLRTIVALIKEKDMIEAERTASLLEKSYPDSANLAEAKFQLGLGYFRSAKKTTDVLQKADNYFAETLSLQAAHVRVKAGAILMRGIIAKRLSQSNGDRRNIDIAVRNFENVISKFPKTSEARRARLELNAINRRLK